MSLFSLDENVSGFVVEKIEAITDIKGTAYVMRHKKSGARLMHLECDDNNKAFAIGFKTPPQDSTGVFHILEHSVLCGSKKYPVKEPFVDLIKTSMQTFLNAMTFSDKTLYPVASTNETDLYNLIDVYMDAVLSPAIYTKPTIFMQEGWHYEIDEKTSNLIYNGVVFNEMKGALSDPSDVLDGAINEALFPDTAYAHISGGHPRAIPTLTYEQFLDNHARHYALDNAYIITYGNIDERALLEHLNQEYLNDDRSYVLENLGHTPGAPNPCPKQTPVINRKTIEMQTTPDNAQVALTYVIGDACDRERVIAADILFESILGSNEAPMKRALLEADLAGEISSYTSAHCLQPYQTIQLRSSKPDVAEKFREIVVEQATSLVENGIPRERLEATLASNEYDLRQRDFGYPDGVVLAMDAMSTWIYDDDAATLGIKYENIFASLREKLNTSYFEDLLREIILDNTHWALVDLKPVEQGNSHEEEAELKQLQASMSNDQLEKIKSDVALLRHDQETPDTPEQTACLPRLTREEIGDTVPDTQTFIDRSHIVPTLVHTIPTNRLAYALTYFDLGHLSYQELPYVTILIRCLRSLDIDAMNAEQLDNYITSNLGFLSFMTEVYAPNDAMLASPKLICSAGAITEKIEKLATIPAEVWSTTHFDNTDKIRTILNQIRISMEYGFLNNGHSCATQRAMSYVSPAAVVRERLSGVDFYLFLRELIDNFDERKEELVAKLSELATRIFTTENTYASFTGTPEDYERYWAAAKSLHLKPLSKKYLSRELYVPMPENKHEAFIIPSDVSYSAMAHDPRMLNIETNGMWAPVMNALSYDYLWNEVRVKGGAYGCSFRCAIDRQLCFASYRDPNIDATFERFGKAGSWLETFEPTPEAFEGFIVSSVASHDAPVKAYAHARRQDNAFFSRRSANFREQLREDMLNTQLSHMHAIGSSITTMSKQAPSCVFGNADLIAQSQMNFNVIDLFN